MAKRWYILNALSGYEQKVIKAIRDNAEKKGVADCFGDLIVPTEKFSEYRRGKKVDSERKIFPGYILLNMELNDLTWNIVKNIPRVTGLLGGSGKPSPIPEKEVKAILQQLEEGMLAKEVELKFDIAEVVRIVDGPFESFTGVVDEVDHERKRLKVSVSIFGRETPVELEYQQVEKVNE